MLIYHMTDNKVKCTEVILGAGKSSVKHGNYVWKKHQDSVNELRNNGRVFVTGATHLGGCYDGMFEDREKYNHYIDG